MPDDFKKSVGSLNQHFLTDHSLLEKMVMLAEVDSTNIVLEIGPGQGNLTRAIAKAAGKVVAIELDRWLASDLQQVQGQYPNVAVIYGNALEMKLPPFTKLVANIPFNITEPLIMRLLQEKFGAGVLLVGQHFARECCYGRPHTRLGLLSNAYFRTDYLLDVPSESFEPPPSTDGAVVGLYPTSKREIERFPLYIVRCLWDQKGRIVRDALSAAIHQYAYKKGASDFNVGHPICMIAEDLPNLMGIRVDKLSNNQFEELYRYLTHVKLKRIFHGHKPRGGAQNWRTQYAAFL